MDARQTDLLDLHDNVTRRVRNLETGVHPLRSEADYADSVPPTVFPKDSGSSSLLSTSTASVTSSSRFQYQKRSGIAALIGWVQISDPQAADAQDANGALWGTLPESLRPSIDRFLTAAADTAPGLTYVLVRADGQVRFFGGQLGETATVFCDGLVWPTA